MKKKEAAPCAASPNPQSPIPTAAPSQSPSPGTAPGASTGTTAPGGKTGTPDGSKLYFKEDAYLVYRFSGTGRFQFWLFSGHQEWKSSDFLNQTYARENRETLNPPSQWLDEYAAAQGWPEITQKEFDAMCKNMNAQTAAAAATTAAPAAEAEETLTTSSSAEGAKTSEPWTSGATAAESSSGRGSLVGTAPATQSLSDAAAACLEAEPAERPGFDYSGMSARTVDTLHVAERMIREARRDYVIAVAQAVSIAHEELCGGVVRNSDNSKHGNRGEDAFRSWCQFIGLSKTTAYQLLQVDALMQGATPEEQAVLEQASPSLLYAAAKPSAPAELVQGVKDGDITTHKQYQELLAQLKAKDDEVAAAEAQRDAALADVDGLSQQNARLQEERDAANSRAESAGRDAAEKDARIRELEARPVEVVGATPADIARWRAEGAEQARRETQRELRRVSAEAAKERKRAEEAERDRDECADTMEKYATQLGELRGRQEMTDDQLHAIYTAEKAADTCTMVICQALDEICDLPRDLKAQAMEHLLNLCICLRKAVDLGYWPTEEDFEDEPDEWPEEDEDV